ncbi:ATP phosphoribosyltransferase [Streptomonospora halophila]|uniref:ATP phosphoribosyltransferase n=2 Tax=Streptomonospora halophila TaxID=427369 RepID=A0ABP9H0I5_9ACTN
MLNEDTRTMADQLRIAVPNKGQLAEPASAMLREAGYRQRKDSRDLVMVDPENDAEFFFLRPKDIAVYVGEGILQAGITGRDMLLDSGAPVEEALALGFGGSTFRFAAPGGAAMTVDDLKGKRIATSFEGLLEQYLERKGIEARVIHLDGAVESSIQLGVADAVADVVSTGTTLRNAGLELFGDPILTSEGVVIRPRGAAEDPKIEQLLRRLRGVLVARDYVMMDYDVHAEQLDDAVALTPGMEGPTVSPLHREGWVAVRAMVPRSSAQRIMDDLWELGARAILVTDIYACRL